MLISEKFFAATKSGQGKIFFASKKNSSKIVFERISFALGFSERKFFSSPEKISFNAASREIVIKNAPAFPTSPEIFFFVACTEEKIFFVFQNQK